jgi:magnesium-protoporphyrin O-methyltransferase
VSTCCSTFSRVADEHFDVAKAAEELQEYRRRGPGPTTRLLRDGLVHAGLAHGTLLDIGAGIGALTFDLLEAGCVRAAVVDASSSYLTVAAQEAARRERTGDVEFLHGDFIDLSARLAPAEVVTLDRVVCCYPLLEPLLARALDHAGRAIALSYPRDTWYVRAAMGVDNLKRRLTGRALRTFVHPPVLMERLIRRAGFRLSSRRQTWMWSADVFIRG